MTKSVTISLQRKSLFLALVLALLLAQWLGQTHSIVHGLHAGHSAERTLFEAPSEHAGLLAHFEHAPDHRLADCQLLEKLTLGDTFACFHQPFSAFSGPNLNLPVAFPSFWQTFQAVYAARAPPLTL